MSKVAIVTGGSRGIGAAISKALKDAGYAVAASYAGNDDAAKAFTAETGITVNVPLFVNIGDKIKVDTRSGDYIGRE